MPKPDSAVSKTANIALLIGIWVGASAGLGVVAKAFYRLFMLGWNVI